MQAELAAVFSCKRVMTARGKPDHDAGEDDQAHPVADAALGDLLAQPHDEGGAGGEGQHGHQPEAEPGLSTIGSAAGDVVCRSR